MLSLVFKLAFYFFTVLLFLFFQKNKLFAQDCNNDSSYYSIKFQSRNNSFFLNADISPQNEVTALGNVLSNDNFVTKFTPQGNVLWSYQYETNYQFLYWYQYPWYTDLVFSKIAVARDSSNDSYITGVITQNGETVGGSISPPPHEMGVLVKIDKFGNVIWGKAVGAWYTDYSIDNIMVLNNGDLLVYLTSYESIPVNRIVRLTNNGQIIWATSLLTQWQSLSSATHAMKELSNGDIVAGDIVYRNQDEIIPRGWAPPIIIPAPIYYLNFFGLDKTTGAITWNSNYRYAPDSTFIKAGFIPDIKHINQLPSGDFSFLSDLYVTDSTLAKYTEKAVNIITDNTGNLKNIIGYSLANNPGSLINVQDVGSNGEQLLLTKDSIFHQTTLTQIDQNGQVEWTKAYANSKVGLTPSYLSKNNLLNTSYVLLSKKESNNLQLVISDKSGNMPCLDLPAKMIAQNDTWQWEPDKISFSNLTIPIDFDIEDLKMKNINYPLQKYIDCQNTITCCMDSIYNNNITEVSLCKGSTYTLPDGTSIQDSGRYYVSFITSKGCDSTVFFQVTSYKNIQDLNLVHDTCFNGNDNIVLTATDSFSKYNWMNTITTQPTYTISKPGVYWVSVSNVCGTKTDSVTVYDKCTFPIYMPNAFTPNGDGLNDVFRLPPQNENKFIRMNIYNRYGQLVFTTDDPNKGWDGTSFSNYPQPAGTYIYYLIMENILGKSLQQNGTVLLIR